MELKLRMPVAAAADLTVTVMATVTAAVVSYVCMCDP